MTAQALHTGPPSTSLPPWIWAALSFALALAVQMAGLIAWGARVEARQAELHATTQPLRDGDLVKIQTDVAWIRAELERRERAR